MNIDKKLVIFTFLGLAVFVSAFGIGSDISSEVLVVDKGDVYKEMSIDGIVATSESIDIGFGTEGRVKNIYFGSGSEVKEGDLVAELDYSGLEAELKNTDAKIGVAKAKLSQVLAGVSDEELKLFERQVESAKIDLENAQKNFENVKIKADNDLEQDYQTAINASDSALLVAEKAMYVLDSVYQPSNQFESFFFIQDYSKKSEAEWQIIFTKDAFKKIKQDYDLLKDEPSNENTNQTISNFKVNLEVIRVALSETQEALDSASVVSGEKSLEEYKNEISRSREDINIIQTDLLNKEQAIKNQKIINNTNILNAENNVNLKRALLSEKEGELALKKTKPRDVEIAVYEAQIRESQTLKTLVQEKIKNMKLYAQVSGIIKSIDTRKGALVSSGDVVVSMNTELDFHIEADLELSEIGKVSIGDEVYVFLNGAKTKGKIVNINNSENIQKGDKEYGKLYIAVFENDISLKPGDKVSVSVFTVLKKGVVRVPKNAVVKDKENFKVKVLDSNSKKIADLSLGIEGDNYFEVLAGLYEGDRIILK